MGSPRQEIELLDLPHLPIHLPDLNSRQGTKILGKQNVKGTYKNTLKNMFCFKGPQTPFFKGFAIFPIFPFVGCLKNQAKTTKRNRDSEI